MKSVALKIRTVEWSPDVESKVLAKHGLRPKDVESALLNDDPSPELRRAGSERYVALCQSETGGDYLFVVFAVPGHGIARVITARRMSHGERSTYRRLKGIR